MEWTIYYCLPEKGYIGHAYIVQIRNIASLWIWTHAWAGTLSFCTLAPPNKTLACGSEKKWPESSPKPFFLLSNPSVLFTLIPGPWIWWEVDEINPRYLRRPTDSTGIAHGISFVLQNIHRYFVNVASSETALQGASTAREQNPAVVGMLAIAFFCAADVFPSPPCKFLFFFSLTRVAPITMSSNKIWYKLSNLQAWSAQ